MILGFKQYFPWGEPTNFREKILAGAGYLATSENANGIKEELNITTHPKSIYIPKIHTFREDKHDRWKPGMSIQMVYRGPKYSILDHFNKGIPELEKCKSIQKVKIFYYHIHSKDLPILFGRKESLTPKPEDFTTTSVLKILVDGKEIISYQQLVNNDGFQDVDQFKRWFKTDWEGKIIQFTDFRY